MSDTKTILYCEDDPVIRRVYKLRLEQAGYHVLYAEDGLDALKCLHRFVPDLIVLDLMMPKFSGEEVLKFVCSDARLHEIPLIILSTNSEVEKDYAEIQGRADRFLTKYNCNPDKLLETIKEILAGPALTESDPAAEDSFEEVLEKIKNCVEKRPST